MGSSLLTPKVRVPDFCNIVSQGFPGQHAWTLFVTPSGCLAAGPGQDGACPSPDTPLGSLAPPCPLGRLPAFREDGPWPGPGRAAPPATSLCFQREIDASRVDVPAGSAEPLRTQPAHRPLWSPGHPFFLPKLCGTPTFSHHVKPFCPDVPKSA